MKSNQNIEAVGQPTLEQLKDLAEGAAFLGTGGGGDPYVGRLLAEQAVKEFGFPKVIKADELADDATVFTVAMVGAPTVLAEKCASGDDIDKSVQRLAEIIGKKPDAIVPAEIGGMNSMLPIVAAARLGLPLVDADGMGRAFPEIQMVTFNVYGASATPAVIVNEHLETVVVDTSDTKRAENLIRASAIEMGLSVMFCGYPMTGRQVKDSCVRGTLSMALQIGHAIGNGRQNGSPTDSLLAYLRCTEYYNRCKLLFDGKVVDLERKTDGGWSVGRCLIGALKGQDSNLELVFRNEYLVARQNGKLVAIVPDLICVIDAETAQAITVDSLKYGQRVKVIGVSAAPIMRTPESLAVFGPAQFGIGEDHFYPLEALHNDC